MSYLRAKALILVADEKGENLSLLERVLTADHHEVMTANSGEQVLSAVASRLPDLILLNIRLPGLDGFEVCRRLKARPETRDIKVMFISALVEVTERAEAEGEIRRSKDLLESIVENLPARIFWKDYESRYLGCNTLFAKDAGHSDKSDLTGKTDFEMGWKDQAEAYRQDDRKIMTTGIPKLDYEEPQTTPEGETRWVRTSKVPLRDRGQQVIGTLGIYLDITERKRAEAQLRKLSRIVEQAPFSVIITDLSPAIEYANPAFCELTGYSEEEVVGQNPRILKAGLTPPEIYREMWQSLKAGRVWRGEFRNRKKSGEVYVERAVIAPVVGSDGRTTHYVALKEDVTERKEAEEALRASEERYRSILNASPDAVAITDLDGRILIVSPMTLRMLGGKQNEDLLGRPILDFVVPEDRGRASSNLVLRLQGSRTEPAEYRGMRLDGGRFDIEVNAAFIRDADRRPSEMVITVRDITRRKQAEEALASSLREKEGLLKETHHRVKNNLALITSLMRITAGRSIEPETKTVLEEMQARIHSVIVLNETLYKTASYTRVKLADYLRQIATHVFHAQNASGGDVRLVLDLEPVDVATAQAIPCGLIVNELLTNSLKHAFPDGRGGEVRVGLRPEADGQVRLCVSDTGAGLPEDFATTQRNSLGLQLVADLARQLRGGLEIAPGPGAGFTVTFSASPPSP